MTNKHDVLVVAGLSGLVAATHLRANDADVAVWKPEIESENGPGAQPWIPSGFVSIGERCGTGRSTIENVG